MKKNNKFFALILILIFTSGIIKAQTLLYEDDFEAYTSGGCLAEQNTDWWITWSGGTGGGEDGIISEDVAHSPIKSVLIDETGGASDLLWLLGDKTSDIFNVSFWMYIPSGYCGYYNFQHFEEPGVEWAIEMYFHTDGTTKFKIAGEEIAMNFEHDTWLFMEHIIDLDSEIAQAYMNGEQITEWLWSMQANGGAGANQLGAINFFSGADASNPGDVPKYYFDDVKYTQGNMPPGPIISYSPGQFVAELEIGQTSTNYLTLGNEGEEDLIYTIDIVCPDEWLSVSSAGGNIIPGGSEIIDVVFDAVGLYAGVYFGTIIILSNDVNNPEVEIPVTLTVIATPHFNFEGGDPSSPLWTIYINTAVLGEFDLVAGDEIGIFDGDLLVGAITLHQVCTPENQFENDLTAFSVLVSGEGYQGGNPYFFKCWDASEGMEFSNFEIELLNPYGDAYTGDVFPNDDGEYSIISLNFLSSASQTFNLSLGFQFISSAVEPADADMLVVMSDVLNENLDFARNSLGQTLRKIGPNWVNGIGDWLIDEGYLIKMNADDSFTISGNIVYPATPIPVEAGFQFVSYFPSNPMDALEAFESIIGDNLDFIRNSQGQTLRKIGPNWVNGIGDCQPDEGYLIKMYADDVLVYPGSSSFTCGDPLTYEGQVYNTVLIGNQCWFKENLNIGEKINGFEEMTDNGVKEKYCYNNNPTNCETYGGLYQWDEIMEYVTDTAVQGICPEGWHLPTDHEWKILEGTTDSQYSLGDTIWDQIGFRGYDAGLNLKTTTGWYAGGNGSGLYAYEALPSGYLCTDGSFLNLENYANFWLSSENDSSNAWFRYLHYTNDGAGRFIFNKNYGFSVRCLQDNSIFENLSVSGNGQSNDLSSHKLGNIVSPKFLFEGGNPADPVYTIYVKGLEIGDEVAAYDGDKIVGAVRISSENAYKNELPVFSTLTSGAGYGEGNPISFKVYSENEILSTEYTMEAVYNSYVADVYPDGDGEYSVIKITKEFKNSNDQIKIFPNPVHGILNIESPAELEIEILDMYGRLLRTELLLNGKNSIDFSNHCNGIYYLRTVYENNINVKKIIVN